MTKTVKVFSICFALFIFSVSALFLGNDAFVQLMGFALLIPSGIFTVLTLRKAWKEEIKK